MSEQQSISDDQNVIIERLRKELKDEKVILLGEGLPQQLRKVLPADTEVRALGADGQVDSSVRVIVLEADEVSADGDLVVRGLEALEFVNGSRVIVATPHNRASGEPRLLKECRGPVSCRNCVEKIITELGVIEVSEVGLVLTEVAPRVATDEVKIRTGTSLHVADNIRVMELWD